MDSPTSALRPISTRYVTGFALHVDQYNDQDPQILTFFKSFSNVVTVGRKPTRFTKEIDADNARAFFRCAVISRRHAKITFADFGNVYIADLGSHHGTHILRPGDTVSRMISPDVPNVLADGDIITFGKTVGREDTLVRPVTARVRLIFGSSLSRCPSPVAATVARTTATSTKSPTSGGRYGVFMQSGGSSERSSSSSSESDSDSDIEEIPRPPTLFNASRCASGRFGLLRQLLPPIHTSEVLPSSQGSIHNSPICVSSSSPTPEVVEVNVINDSREPSVIGAWPDITSHSRSPSRSSSPVVLTRGCLVHEPGYFTPMALELDDKDRDGSLDSFVVSRASSIAPVDAMSSEPVQPREDFTAVPDIICNAEIPDPFDQPGSLMQEEVFVISECPSHSQDPLAEQVFIGSTSSPLHSLDPLVEQVPIGSTSSQSADLFDTRMESLKARLADLEKQFVQRTEDPQLYMPAPTADTETPASQHDAEDPVNMQVAVSSAVTKLKDMLAGMEDLRKKTDAEVAQELEAIRAARAEAEAAAAEAKAKAVSIKPSEIVAPILTDMSALVPTLKRKRCELDDGFDNDHRPSPPVSAQAIALPVVEGKSCCGSFSPLTPPTKRRRTVRILQGIAKTTAIASVGAVAAWSALAFS